MAKGGSEFAALRLARQEDAGEHRRTVSLAARGGGTGTAAPDQAASMATDDPKRRFDDLFHLVYDPAFLLIAWRRVRGNKGARSDGVDGKTARYVEVERGVEP